MSYSRCEGVPRRGRVRWVEEGEGRGADEATGRAAAAMHAGCCGACGGWAAAGSVGAALQRGVVGVVWAFQGSFFEREACAAWAAAHPEQSPSQSSSEQSASEQSQSQSEQSQSQSEQLQPLHTEELAEVLWRYAQTHDAACVDPCIHSLSHSLAGLPCVATALRERAEVAAMAAEGELNEMNPAFAAFTVLGRLGVLSCEVEVPYGLSHLAGVVKEDEASVRAAVAAYWRDFPAVIRFLVQYLTQQTEEAAKKRIMRCLLCYAWPLQQHVFSFFYWVYFLLLEECAPPPLFPPALPLAQLHSIILHYFQCVFFTNQPSLPTSLFSSSFSSLLRALAFYCKRSSAYEDSAPTDFSSISAASPYLRTGTTMVLGECMIRELERKRPQLPKKIEVVSEAEACRCVEAYVEVLREVSEYERVRDHPDQLFLLYSVLEVIAFTAEREKESRAYLMYRFYNWMVLILRTVPQTTPIRCVGGVVIVACVSCVVP